MKIMRDNLKHTRPDQKRNEQGHEPPLHFGLVIFGDTAPEILPRHAQKFEILGKRSPRPTLSKIPPDDPGKDDEKDKDINHKECCTLHVHEEPPVVEFHGASALVSAGVKMG